MSGARIEVSYNLDRAVNSSPDVKPANAANVHNCGTQSRQPTWDENGMLPRIIEDRDVLFGKEVPECTSAKFLEQLIGLLPSISEATLHPCFSSL